MRNAPYIAMLIYPPSFHISLQRLNTASRNFVGAFRRLIRLHLAKKIKENGWETHRIWQYWYFNLVFTYNDILSMLSYHAHGGPPTRGPTSSFATRDFVAKLEVGPRLHGPAFPYIHCKRKISIVYNPPKKVPNTRDTNTSGACPLFPLTNPPRSPCSR